MKDFIDGLACHFTALVLAQMRAIIRLALEALAAHRTFPFHIVALHGYLGNDAAFH